MLYLCYLSIFGCWTWYVYLLSYLLSITVVVTITLHTLQGYMLAAGLTVSLRLSHAM